MSSLLNEYNEMQSFGASQEELDAFKNSKIQELKAYNLTEQEILNEWGVKNPPADQQKQHWDKIEVQPNFVDGRILPTDETASQLQNSKLSPDYSELNNYEMYKSIKKGLSQSIWNVGFQGITGGEVPDAFTNPDPNDSRFERVTQQVTNIVADLPFYIIPGYFAERLTGGKTKGIGGAYAAGFTVGTIRETFLEALERGDVDTFGEWWDIFTDEGVKAGNKEGLMLGGAVATATFAKKFKYGQSFLAQYAAVVGGFTSMGIALEKELPTKDEFIDSLFVIGLLMGAPKVAERVETKIKDYYKKSNKKSSEIVEELDFDPIIKEDIVSKNNTENSKPITKTQERLTELEALEVKSEFELPTEAKRELDKLRELDRDGEIPGRRDADLNLETVNNFDVVDLFNPSVFNKNKVKKIIEEPGVFENHPQLKILEENAISIPRTHLIAEQSGQYNKQTGFSEKWQTENNWKKIVAELSNSMEAGKDKQAVIIFGGSATGKSSYANRLNQGNKKYQIVDPDFVKEHPQFAKTYQEGIGANALHIESKYITKDILLNVVKNGKNLIYPMVGTGGPGKGIKIVNDLKSQGYTVSQVLLEIPANEAVYRSTKRAIETGRYVPIEYVKNASKNSEINYETIKQIEGIGESKRINNEGKEPIIVEQSGRSSAEYAGSRRDGQRSDFRSSTEIEKVTLEDRISFDAPPPNKVDFKGMGNDFVKNYIDKLHPILRAIRRVDQGQFDPRGVLNPYEAFRIQPGMIGRAESFIHRGTLKLADQSIVGKPLFEILKGLDTNAKYREFSEYAVAKRDLELNARNIETGADIAISKKIVKQYQKQYEKAFRELQDYNLSLLSYMKDSGILNQKTFNLMIEANKDYVPFHRVMDSGSKGGNLGETVKNPIKGIKGSKRQIVDPLESIFADTYHFLIMAERNVVNSKFIDFTQLNKKEFPEISLVKGKRKAIVVEKGEIESILPKGTKISPETAENMTIFRRDGQVLGDTQVVIFRNGKREVWEVGKEFAEVIRGLNQQGVNDVVRFLSAPSRWLRAGSTLAPDFVVRNQLRDTTMSAVFSKSGKLLEGAPLVNTSRGIFHMIKSRNQKDADALYAKYEKSGAMQSMVVSFDRTYLDKTIAKELNNTPVYNKIKNPLEILRIVSEFSESTTRLAEFDTAYKAAKKRGLSERDALERAGFEARDITIDFGKIGAKMRALNSLTAFFNARLQGYAKVYEAFRDRPLTTSTKIFSYIMMPSALLWYVNHDDPRYIALPEWQKTMFWIVFDGDGPDATAWRIPKPFELGVVFGTGTEKALDFISGEKPGDIVDFFADVLKDNLKGTIPIPQVAMPFVESWANKSFFTGQPIVPHSMEGILPEYQYTNYTSDTAKGIGKVVRAIMGPTSAMGSPARIDSIIRGWTGTLGQYAIDILDKAAIEFGIVDDTKPTDTLADIPFIRAFVVRNPSSGSEHITNFYELYEPVATAYRTLESLSDPEDVEKVITYLDKEIGFDHLALVGIAKAIGNIRQLINLTYNNPAMSGDEKRQIIDDSYRMMIDIAKDGNAMFEEK